MFPIICQIGPLPVYSYGLMVALAFLVCSFWAEHDARRIGLRPGVISDLVFWLAVGGILGARIFYVSTHFQEFFPGHILDVIMIQKGGLSFQGGFIASVLTGWFFVRRHGLSWRQMLDFCAPFAALGQAIGRIGCFLNGCCYGRHWDHGIFFPVHEDTLYPTQLFDAAGLLVIFFILKLQRKKNGQGIIFAQYLMLAPALRFGLEFFRGDHEVLLYAGLSIYQWVCAGLFLAGLFLFFRQKR